jgi:hypothetical protein
MLIGVVAFLAIGELVSMVLLRVMFGVPRLCPAKGCRPKWSDLPTRVHDRAATGDGIASSVSVTRAPTARACMDRGSRIPRKLEKRLNAAAGGARFEVINLGIGGHSSVRTDALREVVLPSVRIW